MIQSNSFRTLRNPEFLQQGKDLSSVILAATPKILGIEKQYLAFDANVKAIDELYKKVSGHPLTKTLVELDDKRDAYFMGICFIVDAHLKHWDAAIVAQASLLNDSIKVYGRTIIIANYQSESASLDSLIDNWEKTTALTDALTALNVDSWKAELKATNALFVQNYTQRAEEAGANDALTGLKELKEKAIKSWQKLEHIITGKTEEFEDDAAKAPLYEALTNSINGVLDNYNNLIHQRQAKRAAAKAKKMLHHLLMDKLCVIVYYLLKYLCLILRAEVFY
jgi:hypothetical protein